MSHRLPMAHAAQAAGFEVHVATRVADAASQIRDRGFVLHHVPFARGDLSPVAAIRTIKAIRDIQRLVKPVISHHVALQPALFASLAALDQNIVCINAVTGFGFAFTSTDRKARLVRSVLTRLLRLVLSHKENIVIVQNPDDRAGVLELGVPDGRVVTIAGSGVDLGRFIPVPEPDGPIAIGFAGRLLADKGIEALVEAHAQLRARGRDYVLHVAGRQDPANPSSISDARVKAWQSMPGIRLHGHVQNIETFWSHCHIAALPSRREGLPKSLLEAAASGRPLIGTDVPGCREVIVQGTTGLLVPVDDAVALADAIERMASSASLRARYGRAARALAEAKFGDELVARSVTALYESVVRAKGART